MVAAAAFALVLVACGESESTAAADGGGAIKQYDAYPDMVIDTARSYTAVVKTNLGNLTFELLPEEAPLAVNSLVFLAREGFYNGVIFHRVMPGFMGQAGDPTGAGTGGPGYSFAIETPQRPYVRGGLAMANKGAPNTNGSQFFIVFSDLTAQGRLPPSFSLFGELTDGEETLAKIEAVPVGPNGAGEISRPTEEIRISTIEIVER